MIKWGFLIAFQIPFVLSPQNPGEVIAYVSRQRYNTDIYLLQLSSSGITRLISEDAGEYSPAWSPDGCSIAYVSNNTRIVPDILVLNLKDSSVTNVTAQIGSDANYHNYPSWSPDGGKLAYTSSRREGLGLHILDLANMQDFRLTDTTLVVSSSDWSPNGKYIAFAAEHDSDLDIYSVSIDGTQLNNLTNDNGHDMNPSWSPNGQQIAFSSNRNDNWELYVIDADGSNLRRLTSNDGVDAEPDWSPDGKRIAFTSNRTGHFEVYVMNTDGSDLQQLTHAPYVISESPHWQPMVCENKK